MFYNTFLNKNRFNMNFKLSSLLAPHVRQPHLSVGLALLSFTPVIRAKGSYQSSGSLGRILYKNNSLSFLQNQQRYYHISNIRAINRIGPHNEDILSVVIGSLLGDAYANNRSGEGVRICYRQSDRHKEYLF